ncbi:dipeptide epimerase [Salimicrobium jeotgali]|uniref:Dipeptide epimerase n=1 Tax=Salimicrobium jeotgali TaxID=1230341 RepID=K2GG54_9BACI|nr:dipeptide epimerase [Salimicrobium jeotgali]AKG04011.1 dipeptide epimerase [Salimicrobium jeotgali]EKE33052.1 mandelate racemase/muconate lactonizing protein [Salimicrobium jeotgali]MBM7694953.1 L-alanine-DL-glutamate epimerase-like enolase superfamily enzyme [Salimicrobium jeotgali]
MKITDIVCENRTVSLKRPFKTAVRTVENIEVMDVFVKTEEGIEGYGSATASLQVTGDSLEGMRAAVEGPVRDALMNEDIQKLNHQLIKLEKSCIHNSSAKAAVDIALHDAFGKYNNLPIYKMLGGERGVLETDMTVSVDDPALMKQEAVARVREGFDVLKLKVGMDEKEDFNRLLHVKEAVGENVRLRLDANQGWTGKQAVHFLKRIEQEDINVELVEQPVPSHDLKALKYVREHAHVPIMADESAFSPREVLRLVEMDCTDYVNIKLMKAGGLRRAGQIADICESAGVPCMIGSMMESTVSGTAAVHLAMAHPNITMYDLDAPAWMNDEGLKGGMSYEGREVTLNERPGLGFY